MKELKLAEIDPVLAGLAVDAGMTIGEYLSDEQRRGDFLIWKSEQIVRGSKLYIPPWRVRYGGYIKPKAMTAEINQPGLLQHAGRAWLFSFGDERSGKVVETLEEFASMFNIGGRE
ncbi:MAG: hypothetical protein ACXABY_01255 [Candidatus Thorarchaeota archaeon]|jgi:hypothetical protein